MTSSTLLADPPSNETIDVFYINTYFVAQKYGVSPAARGTLLSISTPQNVCKSLSTAMNGFKAIWACDIFVNLRGYWDRGCSAAYLPQGSATHIHELQARFTSVGSTCPTKGANTQTTWIPNTETDLHLITPSSFASFPANIAPRIPHGCDMDRYLLLCLPPLSRLLHERRESMVVLFPRYLLKWTL